MTDPRPFSLPPRTTRADGGPRRVGVEFEFAGLRPDDIVAAVRRGIGGDVERDSAVSRRITGSAVGDLRLELDFRLLQDWAERRASGDATLPSWVTELAERTTEMAERVASLVVPWEIVTGPIPMDQLHRLEPMIATLRAAGALGTRHAPHYAFGTHLNPELPDLEARTVRDYFKAFLCLKDWLRSRARPDLLRSVTPYISDFEADWVRSVVRPGYRPELREFIDDYLEANPTRNRSMDMLPLLAHLDEARVQAAVDDPLVKPRPTLHYRLPNCEIDEAHWSLRPLWHDWLQLERLADDPERLDAMGAAYARWLGGFHVPFDDGWVRETQKWLS